MADRSSDSDPEVIAPEAAPSLSSEAAVVLARIIQALVRDARHDRAA